MRLKDAASSGLFDILLIYTFDRLHRPKNQGDEWQALEVMAYFRGCGVTVEFIDGSIPTDGAYGSLFSILEGLKAGDERRKLIERTQRGRNAKKAEAKFLDHPSFGFRKDSEMRLVVDEERADVVRMIFDLCDRERMGLRLIQKRLIGKVPSPSGGLVWHSSGLHKLLTNVVYWSGFHRSGVPAPPIISEEQAKRVQDRLKANHRLKTGQKTTWPCKGVSGALAVLPGSVNLDEVVEPRKSTSAATATATVRGS